jgi:cytidylate kinase
MSIVAMSETLGSLGNEIGRELAHALGYVFADREIIAKAAEQFGESVLELAHVTEEKPTLWERVADTKRHYLRSVEAVLLEMAARDNVVLSGRGSTILLAPIPHALRVRVTAPAPMRARRLEQTQGLTHEAAFDVVEQTDRERAARIRFLYHVDWDDPLSYDLVLNTERMPVERAVALIRDALDDPRFRSTADSLQMVRDLSLAARARVALAMQPLTRGLALQVTCVDGLLTVSGSVEDETQREAAEATVAAIPGVAGVSNEIVVLRVSRSIPAGM